MSLLVISFIAGVLTILAPCILPVLPIVLGKSIDGGHRLKPLIISLSLATSIIVFTLLLKFSTLFIDIPQRTWAYVSGGIIILFGLITLFPHAWERLVLLLNISASSNKLLGKSAQKKGIGGDILVGAALGPVFSSCSPTYFLILATVLPQNFITGLIYLVAYSIGLALVLLLVGYVGQRFASRLSSFANPHGWFKRSLGILFLLVGLALFTGYDKQVETKLLNIGFLDITKLEQKLLTTPMEKTIASSNTIEIDNAAQATLNKSVRYDSYAELVDPQGFINSESFKLSDYIGKKVILLDFWTYSCINCKRTLPYLTAWDDKYRDQGLLIVGVHTPEFAFEKKIENVEKAVQDFGLKYPVVLDNDYATWRAYGNQYWPRKYLIDIDGYVVYDHIGEGAYEETEQQIQRALQELSTRNELPQEIDRTTVSRKGEVSQAHSPEIYFGALRNERYLGNGIGGHVGLQKFTLPDRIIPNTLYLSGSWYITDEYAETAQAGACIDVTYTADKVFIVAESKENTTVYVMRDGVALEMYTGSDVYDKKLEIEESRLYHVIDEEEAGTHTLELRIEKPGVRIYTFTFG